MHDEGLQAAPLSRLDVFKGGLYFLYCLLVVPAIFFSPQFWSEIPVLHAYSPVYGHLAGAAALLANGCLALRTRPPGSRLLSTTAFVVLAIGVGDAMFGVFNAFF